MPLALTSSFSPSPRVNSVTAPVGVILARSFPLRSRTVAHMFPSGPATILLFVSSPGTGNSASNFGAAAAAAGNAASASTARHDAIRPLPEVIDRVYGTPRQEVQI